jgi:hypothetical protein
MMAAITSRSFSKAVTTQLPLDSKSAAVFSSVVPFVV